MFHRARSTRLWARWVASAIVAGSVSAVSLGAGLSAPAQAAIAVDDATFTWKTSTWFVEHLSSRTLGDGATEDASKVVTFHSGVGAFDPTTGVASVAYQGSINGAFPGVYNIKLEDPVVAVTANGVGTISATVSGAVTGTPFGPTTAVVTRFDATATDWVDDNTNYSLTDTPRWAGVIPAGSSDATEAGITNPARPVDGKSFAKEFLLALPSGLRAHFYASQSANDAKKDPAPFTAEVPAPQVLAAVSAADPDGLVIDVEGANFSGTTLPGDNGVYVGLAAEGGLPDVSSQDNQEAFAASTWIPAGSIADGTFSTLLDAPRTKLDPEIDYAVYTWQAHGHSNASQDTETPVTIDFTALQSTTALTYTGPSSIQAGSGGTLTLDTGRDDATGTVSVSGLAPEPVVVPLTAGAASVTIPTDLAVGSHTLVASYAGDAWNSADSLERQLVVNPSKAKKKVVMTSQVVAPSGKKGALVKVVVDAVGTAKAPTGKVTVTLIKGAKKVVLKAVRLTRVRSTGVAAVALPPLSGPQGTWKVKSVYAGNARFKAATSWTTFVLA